MSEDQNNQAVVPAVQAGLPVVNQKIFRGHEEASDPDDFEIPRAKVVQFTSEESQAANPADRIAAGTIINSLTKKELPAEFIPIYKFTTFIQWNPRKKEDPNYDPAYEPGEMVFQTKDKMDPRVIDGSKFGPNNEVPKVTKYINFLCYFKDNRMPLILSFSKTSLQAGKRLNTLTQYVDMFSMKFKLVAKMKEENGTKYFVLDVIENGKPEPEEYKIAETLYEMFRGRELKVVPEEHPEA